MTCPCGPVVKALALPCAVERHAFSGQGSRLIPAMSTHQQNYFK